MDGIAVGQTAISIQIPCDVFYPPSPLIPQHAPEPMQANDRIDNICLVLTGAAALLKSFYIFTWVLDLALCPGGTDYCTPKCLVCLDLGI